MRRLFLGVAFMAATIPFDFACSNEDDGKSSVTPGDGDGDGDIVVGTGGTNGDGDGDGIRGPACEEFIGLSSCNEEGRTASRRTVNLLLVIDKSGSMDADGGFDNSKWETMKAALEGSLQDVALEINVGLSLYPFPDNAATGIDKNTCSSVGNCCEMPSDSEPNILVGPGLFTVPEIIESFDRVRPGGGTPTAVALEQAYDYFTNGSGADLKGDKYVVLATDGGPNCNSDISCGIEECTVNIDERSEPLSCKDNNQNCCAGANSIHCIDDEASRDAVSRLGSAGIDTFVIGVPGSEAYASVLDSLAEEGGRALAGEDQKYFAVDGAGGVDGLIKVFRRITRQLVTSCDIQLSERPASTLNVNVAVDCAVVPQFGEGSGEGGAGGAGGGEEQWVIDGVTDPPTIRLRGTLCDRVREEGVDRVDVILGCPPVL